MVFNKIIFATILPICLLTACSGNNSSGAIKNRDDGGLAGTSSSGNEAHFSCIIDGQSVSGGAADPMQIFNIGSINDVDEGQELLFFLNDAKSAEAIPNSAHALRFSIPCKTGSVSFGHEENGWGIEVDIRADKDHQATYFSDSFTVNVTKISSTNATGTFSGKFTLREGAYSSGYKKEIEVTDGKFDVPMKK
ncbi:MAG: hypothetical protein Q8937_10320 [Bacteroidota bacterium]|nr:hypothetical protein [Bacteroidota bacterium]